MKKILILVILVMTMCTFTNAQNYVEVNVTEFNQGSLNSYCASLDSILIDQDGSCQDTATWTVVNSNGATFFNGRATHITITSEMGVQIAIYYSDCHINEKWFLIEFTDFEEIPEPWTQNTMWFVWGSTPTLQSYYSETLNYLWSDNSTNWEYTITSPEKSGTIWVRMYNDCGQESDTINGYFNSEPEAVTVDPETDLIVINWEVNQAIAQYVQYIQIYRDGFTTTPIATVEYPLGTYTDEMHGSTASRYYSFKAVAYNGSVCNIFSSSKPSIHSDYTMSAIADEIIIIFNNVKDSYEDLTNYYINEYDGNGNYSHVDSVGIGGKGEITFNPHDRFTNNRDGTITYRAPASHFNGDKFLFVEGGFGQGKRDGLPILGSNVSQETVGVEEFEDKKPFTVYPNPAKGYISIKSESGTTITIYDIGGRIITTGVLTNGVFTTERLTPGTYVVKVDDNEAKKVVVQ